MLSLSELEVLDNQLKVDIETVNIYSNKIIEEKTKVLDDIMRDIKEEVIDSQEIDDRLLERYFLSLTNALYFIGSNVEQMGFYDDMSKMSSKLAYNEAYVKNQTKDLGSTKKQTVADNQMAAESGSINEQVLNLIYSRSFKIIKSKIDAGYEMVRTLSKIVSSRAQEKQLSMLNKQN